VTRARALVCLCAFLCACSEPASDTGQDGSSARIVTLAPNLAELVFAVGAGDQLVGVSAWSDYPRAVLELPEVGDAFVVDQEQLAFLNPDLLLVWESGTPLHTVEELRKRGYRVESVRTRGLDDVAAALRRVDEISSTISTTLLRRSRQKPSSTATPRLCWRVPMLVMMRLLYGTAGRAWPPSSMATSFSCLRTRLGAQPRAFLLQVMRYVLH
jgi:hypothetical protein